jgi:hypothetical protein
MSVTFFRAIMMVNKFSSYFLNGMKSYMEVTVNILRTDSVLSALIIFAF